MRSMAAATGMSQTAISRIWRAFGLGSARISVYLTGSSGGVVTIPA
jgi:hypothetical protein